MRAVLAAMRAALAGDKEEGVEGGLLDMLTDVGEQGGAAAGKAHGIAAGAAHGKLSTVAQEVRAVLRCVACLRPHNP